MSKFNTPVLDAPDQRLREIYIKAQQGQALGGRDVKRMAQRQGVEADTMASGGVAMNAYSAKNKSGGLATNSYNYAGKRTKDEIDAEKKSKMVNESLAQEQEIKALDIKERTDRIMGKTKPAVAATGVTTSPEIAPITTASSKFSDLASPSPTDMLDERIRSRRSNSYSNFA